MKCKQGFSLMVFLPYLLLSTIIIYTSLIIIVRSYTGLIKGSKRNTHVFDLFMARDRIIKDLHLAQCSLKTWKKKDSAIIIYQVGDHDIGWQYTKNALIRLEGQYDVTTDQWHATVKTIIGKHIKPQFQWYQNSDRIERVHITLVSDTYPTVNIDDQVTIRNGSIL